MFSEYRGDRPDPGTEGMGKGLGRYDSGSGTEDPWRQEGDTRRREISVSATATTVVSGRVSGRRLHLWGSRLFGAYRRSLPELSGEPTVIVAEIARAATVTLHPAPQ